MKTLMSKCLIELAGWLSQWCFFCCCCCFFVVVFYASQKSNIKSFFFFFLQFQTFFSIRMQTAMCLWTHVCTHAFVYESLFQNTRSPVQVISRWASKGEMEGSDQWGKSVCVCVCVCACTHMHVYCELIQRGRERERQCMHVTCKLVLTGWHYSAAIQASVLSFHRWENVIWWNNLPCKVCRWHDKHQRSQYIIKESVVKKQTKQ